MKNLQLFVLAGITALFALSCNKEEKAAASMAPNTIQQKLADVAVSAIKEVDPDNWKDWAQTAVGLVNSLNQVEEGNIEELSQTLQDLLVSVKEQDNFRTVTEVIRLSAFTGSITIENNTLKYTPASHPLLITYVYDGKTYKAQLESAGESENGIIVSEREGSSQSTTISVVVPQKAAVHITQNDGLFLDLVVNPVVTDANKDGKLGQEDIIQGSALLQIPDYAVSIQNLDLSAAGASAKVTVQHGTTIVLDFEGKVEMDIRAVAEGGSTSLVNVMDDINGSLSLMGGAALLKASVDLQDIQNLGDLSASSEADAKRLASAVEKSLLGELCFDNDPTVQASLCAIPLKAGNVWTVMPGIRFSDGSADMLLADFFDTTLDVYKPLMGEIASFKQKIEIIFNNLMPKPQVR